MKKKLFFVFSAFVCALVFGGCRGASIPESAFPGNRAENAEVFLTRDGEKFYAMFPRTPQARLLLRAWEKTLGNAGRVTDAEFSGNPVFSAGTFRAGFAGTETFFSVETDAGTQVSVRSGVAEDEFFRNFLLGLPFLPEEKN